MPTTDKHPNETAEAAADLAEAARIEFLTPENTVFTETKGNMLSVSTAKGEHPVVYLHCSFPHTNNRIYISVRTPENKEVGIIKSLDQFAGETAALLEKHIKLRYFAPVIKEITRIKEEYGYSYWETETDVGCCRFTVRGGSGNVKQVSDKKLLITDVDGNRFIVQDVEKLSEKEYRMVEMCM